MTAHVFAPAATTPHGFRGVAGKVARATRAVFRALAYGRMLGVLNEMSDAQLAGIGITRADIPAHARALTHGENAGTAANLR